MQKKYTRVRLESSEDEEGAKEDDSEALARELFDSDDDDQDERREPVRDGGSRANIGEGIRGSGSGESDTEVDDFIVDIEGRPVKTEQRHHGHSNSALREAEEIFGDGFDFDKVAEELEEDEEDDDDIDEVRFDIQLELV